MKWLSKQLNFFYLFVRDFSLVASVLPSSRFLARAMVDLEEIKTAKVIVELGPGEGAITRKILAAMAGDAKLISIDLSDKMIEHCQKTIKDPRVIFVVANAIELEGVLKQHHVKGKADLILSGLGLSLFSSSLISQLFGAIADQLDPKGVFVQFNYKFTRYFHYHGDSRRFRFKSFGLAIYLQTRFQSVERRSAWLNIPSADVYRCRGLKLLKKA